MTRRSARRRTGITVTAAVVAALLAAGCSVGKPAHRSFSDPGDEPSVGLPLGNQVGSLDPAAILQRAQAATAASAFVHIKGQITESGTSDPFTVDMRFTSTGSDGTLVRDGVTARVTRVQNQVWFQGDPRFWGEVGSSTEEEFVNRNKFIQIPVDDKKYAGMVENTYIERLVAKLLGEPGTLQKGETREVNGRKAIALTVGGGGGGTIWVATEGAPYLMRFEAAPGGRTTGEVDFLGYNERTVIAAPDPDQIVDKDLAPQPTGSSKTTRKPTSTKTTSSSTSGSSGSSGSSGATKSPSGSGD
ncbi:hypothetical protein LO772_21395 [Yinghuangia sp. ASG 101]|uniref:hypothetical protein n=1 Tax=Yinghuangia sp. ASG 101 TaxID=2896848 RepID=UPI001E3DF6E9|nr:hypothetical protein [Yinghuangia sp. ASG 101]UGQ09490.1 hypothetical protein LO772_21395 [Yinghuangia sp. ASG 101]